MSDNNNLNDANSIGQQIQNTVGSLIKEAVEKAQKLNSEMVLIDHLTYSVLSTDFIKNTFDKLGIDTKEVIEDIDYLLNQYVESENNANSDKNSPISDEVSVLLDNALRSSMVDIQTGNVRNISNVILEKVVIHILELNPEDYISSSVLKKYGLNAFKFKSCMQKEKRSLGGGSDNNNTDNTIDTLKETGYVVDMIESSDKYELLVGRNSEIERMVQTLARKKKHNVIFTGDPGVGKTALMQGVAKKIKAGDVPNSMKNVHLFSLDLINIMAGAHYRGELESRLKNIIEIIGEHKGILFIDEIHSLITASQGQNSNADAASALKPILNNSDIRVVGTTTHSEYKNIIEKDKGFSRHFQKINIQEPSYDETLTIVKGMIENLATYHGVKYSEEALVAAIKLSDRYITDRNFPDKAIDILDEAGARHSSGLDLIYNKCVSAKHIENIVSKVANVDLGEVNKSEAEKLKGIEKNLKKKIFGQDEAVTKISRSIRLGRAGLVGKEKPIGSYILAGSTGVGKTELAKQISKILNLEMVRFDMSEYMEKHAVSKLIGSPPGYVGYNEGGLLTDRVSKSPNCVLLLDEIEKAHPDILQVLLQIMSDGILTDGQGRQTNFKNVIILMTTNMGAYEASQHSMGFTKALDAEANEKRESAISKGLPPEFINRVNSIIHFNNLTVDHVIEVVSKELANLNEHIKDNNIVIEATLDAKKLLADMGYDSKMGARPVQRLIEEKIMVPLSEEMLFGQLMNGGKVNCRVRNGELMLDFIPNKNKIDEVVIDTSKTLDSIQA